jgi:hypothetical protein
MNLNGISQPYIRHQDGPRAEANIPQISLPDNEETKDGPKAETNIPQISLPDSKETKL